MGSGQKRRIVPVLLRLSAAVLTIGNPVVVLGGMILLGSGVKLAYWFGAVACTAGIACMVRTSRKAVRDSSQRDGLDGIAGALAVMLFLIGAAGILGLRPPGHMLGWIFAIVGLVDAMTLVQRIRSTIAK